MQAFFTGRLLSADALRAEQSYGPVHPGPGAAASAAMASGHSLDAVALNPQPLPPKSLSDAVAASLPHSILDQVALNPQPLPPRENMGELDLMSLQSMVSQRARERDLASAMIEALNDSSSDIATKLGE